MENATKALLIAAAVLIAILIISLGLVVYNMASETIGAVNFSDQEITAFNDKFTQYENEHVRGSEVNAMLKTVLDSNMKSSAEGLDSSATNHPKFVEVKADGNSGVSLAVTATSIGTAKADTSKLYTVTVNRNKTTGFVDEITVKAE